MVGWIYLLDPLVKKARSLDLRGFQRGYSGLLVASIVYSLKLGAWPGGVSGLMPTSWWAGHDLGLIRGFQNASCQHPCPHGRTISPKWLLSVSFLRWFPGASCLSRSLFKISWYFCPVPNSKKQNKTKQKNQKEGSLSYSPPDSNPPGFKVKCSGSSSSWYGISRLWNPVWSMNSLLFGGKKKSLQLWLSLHLWVTYMWCWPWLYFISKSPSGIIVLFVSLVVEYLFYLSTTCSLW